METKPKPQALDLTALGLEVRYGPLGRAVYSLVAREKGSRLFDVWGDVIPVRTQHTIQVGRQEHLLAEYPLPILNHSCDPNCGVIIRNGVPLVSLDVIRAVRAGDELTLDYETFEDAMQFLQRCQCGASRCRSVLSGYSNLPVAIRESYGIYVAEYLRGSK